jgi:hypothetical protein
MQKSHFDLGPTRKHDLLSLFYTVVYLITGKSVFGGDIKDSSDLSTCPHNFQIAHQLKLREHWDLNTMLEFVPEGKLL